MSAIAIAGDVTTTTALALATSWPADDDAVLVEVDPRGGSVAAWLGVPATPSLSSVVAAVRRSVSDPADHRPGVAVGTAGVVDSLVRRTPDGLRFIPAPVSVREAERTVDEAVSLVLPDIARSSSTTHLLDAGRLDGTFVPGSVRVADVIVLVHRQERASPRAAAVRLERFADLVAAASSAHPAVVIGVVGDRPFGVDEIVAHCGVDAAGRLITLPDDPATAAVLAGAAGGSTRRLRRSPLLRDARRAAASLALIAVARSAGADRRGHTAIDGRAS